MEQQKLEFVAKEKLKMQEVAQKTKEEEEKFSKAAQAKLRRSMEVTKENRELQIKALQDKLRDHVSCQVTLLRNLNYVLYSCSNINITYGVWDALECCSNG